MEISLNDHGEGLKNHSKITFLGTNVYMTQNGSFNASNIYEGSEYHILQYDGSILITHPPPALYKLEREWKGVLSR